jgi:TP901 family phage tail tape measure protein
MQKFAGLAHELGENSRYSTLEIAEGATQLAQAGYSAAETTAVLQASLNLAAGSGSTVSEAVDSMTSSLGAFNLQASEAGHVADVLMNGLNESKLSINQMQAALQYAGATAHEAGISIEELTAISASLANAGIKSGSTIGTGIRQLLVDLQTPTDKFKKELDSLGLTMADVDVKSKGLAEVVRTLTKAGFSAEAAYNGFEVRAAAAFLAFRNQIDVYDELSAKLTQTGAAAEAAGKANESLHAKWQATKNTLGELVQILAGPFLNALKAVLSIVNTVVGGFVSFIKGLSDAVGGAQNLSIILTALLPIIGAAFGPAGIIIGGVTALLSLAGATASAADNMDKLQAATNEASEKMNTSRQTVSSVDDAIGRLIERQDQLRGNHVALQVETLNLTEKFEGLSSILGGAAKSYDDLVAAMLRYRGQAMKELGESARGQALSARDQMGPLANQLYRGNLELLDRFNGSGSKRNGFKGEAALGNAYNWVNSAKSTPFENLSNDQLVDQRLKLEKVINDLRMDPNKDTGWYKWYLEHLNTQLATLQQIAATRAKYDTAVQQFQVANVATSSREEQSFKTYTDVSSNIGKGLEANKAKSGSGDAILREQMAIAKGEVTRMQARLKTLDQNSAEAKVLMDDIARMQGEIAKVQRASDEATRDLLKNEKAGPGEDLTGSAVRSLITSQFKGANVYSYQKRSYKEQQTLYNKYKAGKGPLAAKPGHSDHGDGHAVDITPISGITLDQVTRFLESRGVEIKQALDEVDPKTGRHHWHVAWFPKTSNYKKQADNELQHLLEEAAGDQTSAMSTRIAAIISEAKGGAGDYSSDAMGDALAKYQQSAMHEWEVKHPIADAQGDPARLAARAKEKSAEWERVQEQIRKYWADYYQKISDKAVKESETAFKESQRILDEAVRKAEQISKDAQQQLDIAQNRTNRNNVGDGTMYVLNRRKENADIASDQAKLQAQRAQVFRDQLIASQLEASANSMPDGEAKTAQLEKVAEAWEKVRVELQQVNDLQNSLNARTQVFTELPVKERLEGAAQAWMENNGAMDTWAKRAENFVGPALDNLKGGLTEMFSSLMDGSKSWKKALGDMLASFAKFVISYIAECLAMLAITELMKALGVPIPPSMQFGGGKMNGGPASVPSSGGGGFGGPITYAFNGGLANVPGRFSGGITDMSGTGGKVIRGVVNRDSALHNLARDEYVVRSKSVRELGVPFMDAINEHGAKGLAKMGAAGGIMQNFSMPKQETNVFVVKPDSQPAMGPNDVLVTVHEDILQGGATKKLIKQVAQGA